jgi:hypothetical protein
MWREERDVEYVTWEERDVQHAKRQNFTTPGHVTLGESKCNTEYDRGKTPITNDNGNGDTAS